MIVKPLTEDHLEFLSLTGGCSGWSKSTHVKMPHCGNATAHISMYITKCSIWEHSGLVVEYLTHD